ncbi:MAG: F0F1 ATP synthase subunit B [Bacteroidales bacterium]|nr:F0F1 ATP synthase subunit B [Bacteroidales bacterium]
MSFLVPETGLLFWMLLAFGVVFFVLYKYGFPVITSMIDERKRFIDDALQNAKKANEQLAGIQRRGDELLKSAHDEQARIIRDAVAAREKLLAEAREKAHMESEKILQETRAVIRQEKEDALREIRAQVAELSLAIAEKVMRKELESDRQQQLYAKELADEAINEKLSAK